MNFLKSLKQLHRTKIGLEI